MSTYTKDDWIKMAEACEFRHDSGRWVADRVIGLLTKPDGTVTMVATNQSICYVAPDRVRPVAKVEPEPDSQEEIVYVYGSSKIDDAPPPTQPTKAAAVNREKFEAWLDAGQPDLREWWPSRAEPTVRRALGAGVGAIQLFDTRRFRVFNALGHLTVPDIDSAVARVTELIAEHEVKGVTR